MTTWQIAACVAVLGVLAGPASAKGAHAVNGYVKQDGTYVPPHHATNPNGTKADNYGTVGNTNPWTGAPGTRQPTPSPYNPYSPPRP